MLRLVFHYHNAWLHLWLLHTMWNILNEFAFQCYSEPQAIYIYIYISFFRPETVLWYFSVLFSSIASHHHIIINSRKINGRMIWFRMKPPTISIVLTALCTALMILGKSNSHLIHKLIIYRSCCDYVVAK